MNSWLKGKEKKKSQIFGLSKSFPHFMGKDLGRGGRRAAELIPSPSSWRWTQDQASPVHCSSHCSGWRKAFHPLVVKGKKNPTLPPRTGGKKDSQGDEGKVAVPLVQLQRAGEDGGESAGGLMGWMGMGCEWGCSSDTQPSSSSKTHSYSPPSSGHCLSIPSA